MDTDRLGSEHKGQSKRATASGVKGGDAGSRPAELFAHSGRSSARIEAAPEFNDRHLFTTKQVRDRDEEAKEKMSPSTEYSVEQRMRI